MNPTGKLLYTSKNQKYIERKVTFHVDSVNRFFENGCLHDECIYTADGMHLVADLGGKRTLAIMGDMLDSAKWYAVM